MERMEPMAQLLQGVGQLEALLERWRERDLSGQRWTVRFLDARYWEGAARCETRGQQYPARQLRLGRKLGAENPIQPGRGLPARSACDPKDPRLEARAETKRARSRVALGKRRVDSLAQVQTEGAFASVIPLGARGRFGRAPASKSADAAFHRRPYSLILR